MPVVRLISIAKLIPPTDHKNQNKEDMTIAHALHELFLMKHLEILFGVLPVVPHDIASLLLQVAVALGARVTQNKCDDQENGK